jgi:hypothetical protein
MFALFEDVYFGSTFLRQGFAFLIKAIDRNQITTDCNHTFNVAGEVVSNLIKLPFEVSIK